MPSQPRNTQHEKRNRILGYLQSRVVCGVLEHGCVAAAARLFKSSRAMVRRVWRERADLSSISVGGRPQTWSQEAVEVAVSAVPLSERTAYRPMEAASGISRSTLARRVAKKEGLRRAHASVDPHLTEEHKQRRMKFALSFVRENPRKCMLPLNIL